MIAGILIGMIITKAIKDIHYFELLNRFDSLFYRHICQQAKLEKLLNPKKDCFDCTEFTEKGPTELCAKCLRYSNYKNKETK